jgi:hypothetical protein
VTIEQSSVFKTISGAVSTAIETKLGRCATCIRFAIGLAIGSVVFLVVLMAARVGMPWILLAAVPTIAFTTLSAAHGVAYVVRGPAPTGECLPCAEKARARKRAARWRRLTRWLRRPKGVSASRRTTDCKTCGKRQSGDDLIDAADRLPAADEALRARVESSAEYRSLAQRLAAAQPVDTWRIGARSHFVYPLKPETDGEGATALFIARWEDDALLAAMLVTPDSNGGDPHVTDLRLQDVSNS